MFVPAGKNLWQYNFAKFFDICQNHDFLEVYGHKKNSPKFRVKIKKKIFISIFFIAARRILILPKYDDVYHVYMNKSHHSVIAAS